MSMAIDQTRQHCPTRSVDDLRLSWQRRQFRGWAEPFDLPIARDQGAVGDSVQLLHLPTAAQGVIAGCDTNELSSVANDEAHTAPLDEWGGNPSSH